MLLKENPFYVLDVSLSANRRKIAEAADEIGFLLGTDKSGEAQSILTNPGKRLSAELAWFPEANDADIASIRDSLSNDQPIITTALTGYSKLNALVYNLGITEYSAIYELGFDIVSIDEQYSSIDVARITETINRARETAGIATVSETEVQDCHRTVIEEIRKLINEKLKSFDEKSYIDFVTVIAEQYIADNRHNAGPILFDIVDQYEIRMQSEIETRTNQIIQYVDLIKSEQNKDIIKKSIPKVIERVEAWDTYAQPLQLRSQATGLPHETSRKLASEMRGLCLFLHNEKELTTEARDLASAMKAVFLEVGEFREIFTNDTDKLNEIEKDNENAGIIKEIQADFDRIDSAEKALVPTLEPEDLKKFADLITSINTKIQGSKLDNDTKKKLRTALCYRARKVAIDIHNDIKNPMVSRYLICVLTDLFKDIEEPRKKLKGDYDALSNNISATGVTMDNYKSFFNKYVGPRVMKERLEKKERRNKWIKAIVALVIVGLVVRSCINAQNKNSSSSRSTYGSSYGSTSTKNTKKPSNTATTKSTTKPTAAPEKAYSSSSKTNDYVYVDVVSVFPKHAVYTSSSSKYSVNLSYYSRYICSCETSTGKTVWISFDATEYKKVIDPTISNLVNTSKDTFDAKTLYYNPAARIHGKVVTPESVIPYDVKDRDETIKKMKTDTVISFSSIDIPDQVISITNYNVKNYFDISVEGKEFDSTKGLTVTFTIKPKLSEYATRKGSSSDISIKLQVQAYKTENGTIPFQTKDYTVVLKKTKGYKASGEIFVPFKMDLDTVYWGYSVESCNGAIGN